MQFCKYDKLYAKKVVFVSLGIIKLNKIIRNELFMLCYSIVYSTKHFYSNIFSEFKIYFCFLQRHNNFINFIVNGIKNIITPLF